MNSFFKSIIVMLLLIFLYSSLSINKCNLINSLLLDGNIQYVRMDFDEDIPANEISDQIIEYAITNDVIYGEYVIEDNDVITVYTTNHLEQSLEKKLEKLNLPFGYNFEFLQLNKNTYKNIGLKSNFFIEGKSGNKDDFLEFLSKFGVIQKTEPPKFITKTHVTAIFVSFMEVIILLMMLYFAEIIIYRVTVFNFIGKSQSYISKKIVYALIKQCLSIPLFIFLCIAIYLGRATIAGIIAFLINVVCIILIVYIYIYCKVYGLSNPIAILNGKFNFQKLKKYLYITKALILIIVMTIVFIFCINFTRLLQAAESYDAWKNTINEYGVNLMFNPNENLKDEHEMNEKILKFYKKMNQNGAILIDATNYIKTGDKYLYEYNKDLTDKSIVINENYLKNNPIYTKDGKDVLNSLNDFNKNELNVLVPYSYKSKETEIEEKLLNKFYFAKVEVKNIYNDELGRALESTTKNDLKINIIYVKDNQSYFSYNYKIMKEKNFFINDPIAIIYNDTIDSSFATTFIDNIYFNSTANMPYSEISSIVYESEASNYISSVHPIYDDADAEIMMTRHAILISGLLILVSIIFLIMIISTSIITMIFSEYEKMNVLNFLGKNKNVVIRKYILECLIINLATYIVIIMTIGFYQSLVLLVMEVFLEYVIVKIKIRKEFCVSYKT